MLAKSYGPPEVFQLGETIKPVPKEKEILVKIHATAVTSGDARIRNLNVPAGFGLMARLMVGINQPRNPIMGMDFSGKIESLGNKVTQFKVGDRVFGAGGSGTYAQYLTIGEDKTVTLMPPDMTFEEAAAIPFGALSSLIYLRDLGKIQKCQKLLINGASGCLGTYAVQLGKYFGAEVTGVCSTKNLDLVSALGADYVIDYTKEEFTQQDKTYDIIFDTVGTLSFSQCKESLEESGKFLMAVAGLPQWLLVLRTSIGGSKKAVAEVALPSKKDLNFIKDLFESGKIKPVIDRSYSLEELAEAHRYVDMGHKKGSVVIQNKPESMV